MVLVGLAEMDAIPLATSHELMFAVIFVHEEEGNCG
jgi:hypothetical protein